MVKEWVYLPVKTDDPTRISFSRKHMSELTELDKDYEKKKAALGPKPDKDIDGSIEYDDWIVRSGVVVREYLNQL